MKMDRMKVNILGLLEVRGTNAGEITGDQHRIIYSGRQQHGEGLVSLLIKEMHGR